MKSLQRLFILLVIVTLSIFLASCSKTAENEHLPEYCQTYSGFMSTASRDMYELLEDVNRYNYLSVISEIELEFEVDDPTREIDLDGIQCFQNLTSLTLIGQSFKDISPISALKNIQKIVLIDTSIVSIDSFKNLSKVNELTISNTKTLQSVDGVEEMTKLTRLDLSDNGIVNIDGLNNLVNLTELILSNNEITYFPSINQLELLETLDVSNNNIEQLGEDLSGLRNLKEFIARENNICDLSTLDDLVSIEILDLSENNLGCGGVGVSPDFSSLENAPNLREIYLNDNNLTSIEDLRGKDLPLEVLHLQNNNLTDITPIGNYTGIQELVLFNNNITNIDDLSGMINVTEIDLSENSIIDFSDLLGIPNLEFIDLSDNNITFIPDMSSSWANLRLLDLDSNIIIDSSGVEGHANLRELILSNNGMTELAGISHLPLLESLVLYWDIPDVIPEDFVFEDNPNDISVIRDSFNSVPLLELVDETATFDFGFELGSSVEIYNSISDIDGVGTIDFSEMDIDYIDPLSINLPSLLAIDVSNNNITDIEFILNNPSLQILDISYNSITNLSVISGDTRTDLKNLNEVNASNITTNNVLSDAFIGLPELSYLDLYGTSITSINNCFNDLSELTELYIDSPVLESIIDSFNDLYYIHTDDNVIIFSNSKIGVIDNSFNGGLYEQIVFENNSPDNPVTMIVDSFNNLSALHNNSIYITGNDFKTITGSFNGTLLTNLFLGDNNIETITTSFSNLSVIDELYLMNNNLETLVGLNTAIEISSLNISNNLLTTVAFLDGIAGLESLNISNQYNDLTMTLTLTTIDGINNMPSLTEIIMEDLAITNIDGFKNIGIDEFILSETDNNGVKVETISSSSFISSPITDLDLSGHELDNIDFLDNLDDLIDLDISINIADLSDFQGLSFEGTLEELTLENIQEVTEFNYLSNYDSLVIFSFDSDLTLVINNFDGLDSINNANFENKADITTINGSFNNMASLNLTGAYLSTFSSLANISTSFDVFDTTDSIEISGDLIIVDSFDNLGTLNLASGSETSVNFDTDSFDNMHSIFIANSNFDSLAFLNGYIELNNVTIQDLDKNITGLVNQNITSLNISNVNAIVTVMTFDIADTGALFFGSNTPVTVTVTADSSDYDLNSSGGEVTLELDNIGANLNGDLNILTVNSTNLATVVLEEMETTNMTFNTDALALISRVNVVVLNANVLEVNSLVATLDINVKANTLNLYDVNTTSYDLTVTGGDANLYSAQANLTIDFTGQDLNIAYDALETIDVSGDLENLNIVSTAIDDIDLGTTAVNGLDITSSQSVMSIVGTSVQALQLTNNNITDPTLTLLGTDIVITSITSVSMNVDISATSLNLETVNLPSVVFSATSALTTLDLTDGTNIDTITYNAATVTTTNLVSDEAVISLTGTNVANINVSAENLTSITANTPSGVLDIDSLTTTILGDIIATTTDIDGANLTDLTLAAASDIGTLNILNSITIDTLDFSTADIDSFNLTSNVQNIDISAVNVLETALSGDNYISVITDLGANNLTFATEKTSSISFDITATDVVLNTKLSTISIDNASNITNLAIASDTLANVLGGSATISSIIISGSSDTLNVTGSNLTTLTVDDALITTFDANVGLSTTVDLTTLATALLTINASSSNITITSQGDISLTSATLIESTINIGNNDATFNLSKAALDYTLLGTMGDIVVTSSTMNNFIVGTNLVLNTLEIVNDNITSLDLSPGTISNLSITSTNTTIDILGNGLDTTVLNMDNLTNMTVNSTNIGSSVSASTLSANLSLSGTIDNVTVVGNSLSSIDLNGIIDTVSIEGSSLTSVDLNDADYNNLVLDTDSLAALNTYTTIDESLEVTTTIDDFNLTTITPVIDFLGGTSDNLNLSTTVASMTLSTTNDSIALTAATTEFTITGSNLNGITGTAKNIDITGETGAVSFVFDLDADAVVFNSNTPTALLFTGVRTIAEIEVVSSSITTLNTNSVVVTTLDYTSSGVNTTVDTKATTINHINTTTDEVIFNIDENSQVLNTNSEIVTLSSGNVSSTILNYSGSSELDLTLSNLATATINVTVASSVTIDGNSNDLILSGAAIDAVDTTTLTLSTRYTMNGTLITDLEFISAGLLASLTEIEVDSLIEANVGSIITKLDSSVVTLFSPITSPMIYDYYYDDEYSALTAQEAIDTVRYDGFRDTAIADALAEFRLNAYFDYITDDSVLENSIDTQTYDTMENYLLGYADSIGHASREDFVLAESEGFVVAIEDSIQTTLDKAVLIIVEVDLNASVVTSIENDSDTHATTESGNIGFNIG